MNSQILRQLSFAFFPIIVFIIADELYGVIVGMAVAMFFSVGEFLFTIYKEKRVDFFILFDVILISVLGGISIISHNDIFFKLKPALVQSILLILFGIAAFTNYPLMENMTKRYMKDMKFSDFQRKQMKKMSKQIFFIFLIHTSLIIYTAFYSSRAVWAFASGGLFYIIMAIFMLVQWWQGKNKVKSGPFLDIFNENEEKIGEIPELLMEYNPNLIFRETHLYILNKEGEIFLKVGNGLYEIPISSKVYSGETISDSIKKNINLNFHHENLKPELLFKYLFNDENFRKFIYSFYIINEEPVKLFKTKEVGMFFTFSDIRERVKEGIFNPLILKEIGILENITKEIKDKIGK